MSRFDATLSAGMIVAMLSCLANDVIAVEPPATKRTPPVAVIVNEERHSPDLTIAVSQLFAGTNDLRRENGRDVLRSSMHLTNAAADFANFMADTDRYGHDADGRSPATRASAAGFEYCMIAENIAYQYLSTGFTTEDLVQSFLEGWKNSAGHRANMLETGVTQMGVAIARSRKSGKYYGVQLFGRPKSQVAGESCGSKSGTG